METQQEQGIVWTKNKFVSMNAEDRDRGKKITKSNLEARERTLGGERERER